MTEEDQINTTTNKIATKKKKNTKLPDATTDETGVEQNKIG
jgi:hypothetical protein